ncbi:Cof-type HAD-IIB family hydrolase [Paenibacillus crassostreae]|uniref:Hydrolase n=1 Tax=Paenibacillus crassostreae TaxID=1763538 RepID=A0A167ANH6_9BACL|nr:Cof-type HAD-IIB family hydrolase [Paenibacillus crassostreae]AOZ93710.1 hypothetical protein LPB68_16950 [Paenibacillus crassostreae]OAB71245.1 hypothetical protein PNBC_19820 [Paenibacillus crassostreae]
MYELLALDMDGTLLNSDKRITPNVHHALTAWRNSGRRLTIASGRFPASVWLHARATEMNFPLIALNGSVIVNEDTGELISSTPLSAQHTISLTELIESHGAYIQLYGYNVLYVSELNHVNSKWPLANVVVIPDKPLTVENYQDQINYIQVEPVDDLREFLQKRTEPIYKATILCDHTDLLDMLIAELQSWNLFMITRTGSHRFDVNAFGVSKRSALEHLCLKHQIPSVKVAAIGDYDNDVEMLKWAGLGIAMGNAEEHVKQISNRITSSNQDDGVAEAVLKLINPN